VEVPPLPLRHDAEPKPFEGELVKKKMVWVFASNFLPLAIGVYSIPLMVDQFGNELFGFLTILWVFVGYFSLFDFGIGRALTQSIAHANFAGDEVALNKLYSTGMTLVVIAGVVAGVVVYFSAGYLSYDVFKLDKSLQGIAESSLEVTGVAVVFTVWATGLRGVLEGFERFKIVSVGRIPLGVWMFVGPLIFFHVWGDFVYAVASLALARLLLCLYYFLYAGRMVSYSFGNFCKATMFRLLRFGGWMTLSNAISPVMVYFDRFFIGSLISVGVVSFYTTPYEMATKLLLVPASIGTVLFPRISALLGKSDFSEVSRLQGLSYLLNAALIVPALLVIYFFGEAILDVWLGAEYARKSYVVFWVIVLGVLANSLASVPYNIIQAAGGSKVTAILHVVEAPFYLGLIFYVMEHGFGIEGVAWVWVARCVMDWLALEILRRKFVRYSK
jgi:O-antigen/teichoic acid export membrane protein